MLTFYHACRETMHHNWLGPLVVLLVCLETAPADFIHPERGEVMQRVKRSLAAHQQSENQVEQMY
jgi:hypothetical protein